MKQTKTYIAIELFLLFIGIPVILASTLSIELKLVVGLIGFVYLLWIGFSNKIFRFQKVSKKDWKPFFKQVLTLGIFIIIVTTIFVYYKKPDALFYVPLHKPLLFFVIATVYAVFSVMPQEFVYRTFFFHRYGFLFSSKAFSIFVNGILFSLAHLFFKNTLVLVMTFIGGVIFALTYLKFKNTWLVTLEHAIYGCWIFAVGMGEMLAFPGMEN